MAGRLRGIGFGTLPGERAVDSVLVDHAAAELRRIDRVRGLAYARAVGSFLLRTFFSDSGRLCGERARAHCSYRALARRSDLPMSRSTLYRCVQVELQCRELPADLAEALSVSHHATLFSVADPLRKRMLARRAVDEALTCRQLAALELHGRARKSGDSRRGRPPLPALVKRVNGLGRVVAQVEDLSLSAEGIASYGAQRCREMRDALEEHLATLEDLRDTVDHALELAEHEPGGGTQRAADAARLDVGRTDATLTASP